MSSMMVHCLQCVIKIIFSLSEALHLQFKFVWIDKSIHLLKIKIKNAASHLEKFNSSKTFKHFVCSYFSRMYMNHINVKADKEVHMCFLFSTCPKLSSTLYAFISLRTTGTSSCMPVARSCLPVLSPQLYSVSLHLLSISLLFSLYQHHTLLEPDKTSQAQKHVSSVCNSDVQAGTDVSLLSISLLFSLLSTSYLAQVWQN
jgi:hypothetical protein